VVERFDPKRAYAAYAAKISADVQRWSIASQIAITIGQKDACLFFSTNDKDDTIKKSPA
jgi:hypothetical protein